MELGPEYWQALRQQLQFLLSNANKNRSSVEAGLLPLRGLKLEVPCIIGDYTDFYASRHHARRVGELFRPDAPLFENYDWVPIAYHGRASSIVASGAAVRRPHGQIKASGAAPRFGRTERLDYELELAYFVGTGNPLGEPVSIAAAASRIFGVSLMNDWSARDIQAWEYQPLGPFLGKSFCTSVSPWVTPLAALSAARVPAPSHENGLLAYLDSAEDRQRGGLDMRLEVRLSTARSRAANLPEFVLSRQNSADLWWTPAQMLAHHTGNGCNLRAGDMLATGTVSGASREAAGCLLELTRGGAELITLPNGETRHFLEDDDEIVFQGWVESEGEMPIHLGECRGRVTGITPPQS
jgi:fumarylacetoacetase